MKVQTRKSFVCIISLLAAVVTSVNAYSDPAYAQSNQLNAIGASNPYQMQSTSPWIGSRSVSMGATAATPLFGTQTSRPFSSQLSPISFFSSRDSKKRAWTKDNMLTASNLMNSGSRYASGTSATELNGGGATASSGPRRVGGNDHDPDPFMGEPVPVGQTPFIWMALMAVAYAVFVVRRRKQFAATDKVE